MTRMSPYPSRYAPPLHFQPCGTSIVNACSTGSSIFDHPPLQPAGWASRAETEPSKPAASSSSDITLRVRCMEPPYNKTLSMATPAPNHTGDLRRELGLRGLVLAQILNVVGSSWVGVASKLGKAHAVFWMFSMLLFYVPLALVVIHLNRTLPLEGGLYQWAKAAFGEFWGFLIAWNLWVYAVVVLGSILFVVPTDLAYSIGPRAAWLPASHAATSVLTG